MQGRVTSLEAKPAIHTQLCVPVSGNTGMVSLVCALRVFSYAEMATCLWGQRGWVLGLSPVELPVDKSSRRV